MFSGGALEDDEHRQVLVSREAVVRAALDEHCVADPHVDRLPLHLEPPFAVEDDVHFVVLVRLLPVGVGRDEHVHPKLHTRGLVHDLVAAAGRAKALDDRADAERVHQRPLPPNACEPVTTASLSPRRSAMRSRYQPKLAFGTRASVG